MNKTKKLLRVIGSPFAKGQEIPQASEVHQLYAHAIKNKMPLLFLEAINKQNMLGELRADYDKQCARYTDFLNAVSRVCRLLDAADVDYAIIKTISPFMAVPNDIDVLALGTKNNYAKAIETLSGAGYKPPLSEKATTGPRTDILQAPETGFLIDLQKEMGAHHIIDFSKKNLHEHLWQVDLENGQRHFWTVTPQADLAITVGHSLIAEQLYTLSEYYITLYYLDKMSKGEISDFVSIVRENCLAFAVGTYLALTATLHEAVHDKKVEKLDALLAELGRGSSEAKRAVKNGLKMTHRFRLSTVFRVLMEKVKEREARKSIGRQMVSLVTEPRNTVTLIKEVFWRRTRETY